MSNPKPKIFGIGISGFIGSRVVELLSDKYEFQNLSIETGVDITDPASLAVIEHDREHDIVIHLAAKADVDGCESDKHLGKDGSAWRINVFGTQNVVNACIKSGKKIVYISTDFVFDGTKPEGESYSENDTPNPTNWYAQTKYEGEKIVRDSGLPYLILRPAYPYRTPYPQKKDLVQAILTRLRAGEVITAVTDHFMTPTYVDDFAHVLDVLMAKAETGIYHVVGSESITPYAFAKLLAESYGLDSELIQKTTREEFFSGRAPRPFNLSLNNDRIEKLGVKMKTVTEGIAALQSISETPDSETHPK